MQLNLTIHEQALSLRQHRSAVLANNIINEETPNYKARDFDFGKVLTRLSSGKSDLVITNSKHFVGNNFEQITSKYRTPNQPSIDNNTVEIETENRLFAENAINYQASFTLLNNRFNSLNQALRSE